MKRILFVDDEPAVLEGLRNVLRAERAHWDMSFALGGEAALSELEGGPFDVIVTDMRMPGMDGLALLEIVRKRHPQVARIVLSGRSDLASVTRATSVAHQYLLKPCERDSLRAVVNRALGVQALLEDDQLRKIVGGLGTLPSAPRLYQALTAALSDPEVDIKKLAAIVKQDVALSTRVLQFVNSAYCGLVQRISSIEAAIVHFGLNTMRHLALTVEVFRSFAGAGASEFEQAEHHALLTARIARKLAPKPFEADLAFAAGLLHDVGKLVLMSRARELYQRAVEQAQRSGVSGSVAEKDVLGATHAEIGAYLLGLWDLPHEIVESAAFHHSLDRTGRSGFDMTAIIMLADTLAHDAAGEGGDDVSSGVLEKLAGFGDVDTWKAVASAEARAARTF